MQPSPVQFAASPAGKIAFQTVGDGPIDVLFHPGPNNLDAIWDDPALARFFQRIATFARLILCNRRGSGLSDPLPLGSPLAQEDWAEDFLFVLDAAGADRVALVATEQGGIPTSLFAATHPERVASLTLINCYATLRRQDDYLHGLPPEPFERFVSAFLDGWGSGRSLNVMAPELANNRGFREWLARMERLSMSPSTAEVSGRATFDADIRAVLAAIRVPALVITHTGHPWIRSGHGHYLAEHIPTARYVERSGFWGLYWVHDVDFVLDEVETFLTGTKTGLLIDDRVLATVLMTDIVNSTVRAAEIGDQRWRSLLDEHDAVLHREIDRFRGRLVKSTGDGCLATFDGPARAIRCAVAMKDALAPLGISIRIGLHTGEIELRRDDVAGIAVHIASRVMTAADGDEVLVSESIPPLVTGSGIEFSDRGSRELKGIPGEWRLFSIS